MLRFPPHAYATLPAVDVLVLGAGLAGLRAAWAAGASRPGAAVAVVLPGRQPAGSSFANVNGRLGVQAPATDREREAFCREVAAVAGPGLLRPELVAILAEEALPRRRELEEAGAAFLREKNGALTLFGACFSPDSRRCAVVGDLPGLGRLLRGRAEAAGGQLLPGLRAVALLRDPEAGRVCGATLEDAAGRLFLQPAGAVVAALGGPAPLFARHQGAPDASGFGQGLLAGIGVPMANTTFLQWMWATLADRRFWPVWELLDGLATAPVPLPEAVAVRAAGRAGHCPLGHGLADAALDCWLLATADADGLVTVKRGETSLAVALFAHATNGGAVVDALGRTGVPALFAAGECATGMHGANRLGGAMTAACLVFGARAGKTAAAEARRPGPAVWRRAVAASLGDFRRDVLEERTVTAWLARTLQQNGLPCRGDDAGLAASLAARRARTRDAVARALLDAAALLVGAQAKDFPPAGR